jgi:hypothetical protein
MLRRLAAGVALVAALALAGCTPPEPTDEEVVAEATEIITEFYAVVDSQFASGAASARDFEGIAEQMFAAEYSQDVQELIDDGYVSRGVPEISAVALVEREASGLVLSFCADGTAIRTTGPDGQQVSGQLIAWSADFAPRAADASMRLMDLTPIGDATAC